MFLGVSGIPANATTIQLVFIDQFSTTNGEHDGQYDFILDYPVSSFTNGLLQLTTEWPLTDAESGDYIVYAESVTSHGDESAATIFDDAWMYSPEQYNWGQPFYDASVQMKQNLIFQLRAAPADGSFQFRYGYIYISSTDYVAASLYQYNDQSAYLGQFDAFLPFENNYLFRNFVLSMTNVDSSGNLTTGISGGWANPYCELNNPTFTFDNSFTQYESLLSTNSTAWLFYDQISDSDDIVSEGIVGVSSDDQGNTTISLPMGKYNWFGLPYASVGVVGTSASSGNLVNNVVTAGHAVTSPDFSMPYTIYAQTAQPQFQTKEYDFWATQYENYSYIPLPGDPNFSITNKSQLLISSVGNEAYVVAGFAKMACAK